MIKGGETAALPPSVSDADAHDDAEWFTDHPDRRYRARPGWVVRRRGRNVFLRAPIALNPQAFKHQTTTEILQTLLHEMVHCWEEHYAKPSKNYHGEQFARKMEVVGLQTSDSGRPGGKRTGAKMLDYPIEGGLFLNVAREFLIDHGDIKYVDRTDEKARKVKNASKTRFTCPQCGLNLWGKPNAPAACGECWILMIAAT